MAGWKLRKDKAQAETPETSEETTEETAIPQWETPTAEPGEEVSAGMSEPQFEPISLEGPEFQGPGFDDAESEDDAEPEKEHTGGVIALGGETEAIPLAPLPDFEAGDEVSFDEDDEAVEDNSPAAMIFPEPTTPVLPEMPVSTPPAPETAPESISTDSVPEVAPFVVNTPAAPPAADLPHRLVMRVGRLSAAFELTKEVTVIGRPDSNLHYYPDVEIEMDDAVSRRHAEVLKAADGQYYLLDSGSTNGTRLNGETLPPNEERLLAHGDRIHVGERTEIIFE